MAVIMPELGCPPLTTTLSLRAKVDILLAMMTFDRLSRAAIEPLPALVDFLQPVHIQFGLQEGQTAPARYLTRLLTESPCKNCNTLAAIVPGTCE
jgi:hypothetical protein